MPYQIYCAYVMIKDICNFKLMSAIDEAFTIAIGNMPDLAGSSLIILDVSGSMSNPVSSHSRVSILEMSAVYAACTYLACRNSGVDCDVIKFGTTAGFDKDILPSMSAMGIVNILCDKTRNDKYGYGTYIYNAMELIDKKYDRVFVFSDLQACAPVKFWWEEPKSDSVKDMLNRTGIDKLYSFDLGTYSNTSLNSNDPRIHFMTAIDENVLKFIRLIEEGDSIVNYIRNYPI